MTTQPTSPLATTDTSYAATVAQGIASLVWWQFSGTRLTTTDLQTRVQAAGMDPDTVPEIDPIKALHRAVREFSVTEGRRKVMEAVVAEDDATAVVVNLLELQQVTRRKMAKVTVDTLVWDKGASCWLAQGTHQHAQQLRDRVADRQQHHDGNDVRDLLVQPALQASSAFTLRRGMCVVPHASAAPLAQAQAALAGLDSFQLHVASVGAGQGWEAPMQAAAQDGMRDELAELQQQIEGWRSMASRVRSDTVEHVLARFTSLRERAELYAEALQVSLDDLQDEVADMEQVAMEVIDGKAAEADERAAVRTAPTTSPEQARREALAGMADAQLAALWDALGDGDQPADRAQLVEQLAQAMEAQAAA
jgi:hypothetical protein